MDLFNTMAKLSLDSSQFDKGLRSAERGGKNLATKLEASFTKIQRVIKTSLAAVAVKKLSDAMLGLASATATAGDRIDKQSQQLGMSRKAFQMWDYILGQSGADIDSMSTAMKTMNDALAGGSAETKKALKDLGASEKMMKNMSVEDQFEYLVHLFQQMPESAKKSQIAVKLFGKQGQVLLPLLNTTSEDMWKLKDRMEELGLYMSDDAVDASVAYGDAVDDMKRTFNSFKYAIGASILPTLTRATTKIASYAGKIKKAYDSNGFAGVFKTLAADIRKVINWDNIKGIGASLMSSINSGITSFTVDTKLNLAKKFGVEAEGNDALTWWRIGLGIARKIWDGIQGFNVSAKNWLKTKLGIDDDETDWAGIGLAIIQKIWGGIESFSNTAKGWLASKLGLTDEANSLKWSQIGMKIAKQIRDGMMGLSNAAKGWLVQKLGIESEVSETSWLQIGLDIIGWIWDGINSFTSSTVGWLATKLGITSETDDSTSWTSIGTSIIGWIWDGVQSFSDTTKGWLATLLGIDAEVNSLTWVQLGAKIINKIRDGLKFNLNTAKNWLAERLGIKSEAESATWGDIGKEIMRRIKDGVTGFSNAVKVNLAERLGIQADADQPLTWWKIGATIMGRIRDGVTGFMSAAKINLAQKLGLADESGEPLAGGAVSWKSIGSKIIERIKEGLSGAAVNFANLLGLTDDDGNILETWSDVGQSLIDKAFGFMTTGGSYLKKLLLGADFEEESTWTDVGNKVWGWLETAFEGKDIIGTLFANVTDKTAGIVTFAANIGTALVSWIGENTAMIVPKLSGILADVISGVAGLVGQIVPVLVGILGDPEFIQGLTSIAETLFMAVLNLFTDPKTYQALSGAIGAILKALMNVLTEWTKDNGKGLTDTTPGQGKAANMVAAAAVTKDQQEAYAELNKLTRDDARTKGLLGAEKRAMVLEIANEYAQMTAGEYAAAFDTTEEEARQIIDNVKADLTALGADNFAVTVDIVPNDPYGMLSLLTEFVGGGSGNIRIGNPEEYNAKGLWSVPYDNYVTRLHRGERVLSASQARHDGGADTDTIVQAVTTAISQSMKQLMGSLKIVLNNRTVGQVVGDSVTTRVNNNIGSIQDKIAYGYGR